MPMASKRNDGIPFDLKLLGVIPSFPDSEIRKIEEACLLEAAKSVESKENVIRLIGSIDLTTLSGDDTTTRVQKLFQRALNPLKHTLASLGSIAPRAAHCAAVCTYPARVPDVVLEKKKTDADNLVKIASVAGGFPSGQYKLETRVREIELAVDDGAMEIDIVINRCASLEGDWKTVYEEVKAMKKACGKAHLKTILATGELQHLENVYKASMVSMMAGSDFIKTSTGKEAVNATIPVSYVMCTAIKQYFDISGARVGFKAAGGIKTVQQGLTYEALVKRVLGSEWVIPELFRIGASSLLDDIEATLLK